MLAPWLVLFSVALQSAFAYNTVPELLYAKFGEEPFNSVKDSAQGAKEDLEEKQNFYEQCKGPNGQQGRCVPFESCILPDAGNDSTFQRDYRCTIKDQRFVGVCCPHHPNSEITNEVRIFDTEYNNKRYPRSPAKETTLKPVDKEDKNAIDEPYPIGDYIECGRNGKTTSRTSAKAPTTIKDWPWMVAIINKNTSAQFCGGTIITKRHVLTAAHCFVTEKRGKMSKNPKDLMLLVGDYKLSDRKESRSKPIHVDKIIVHEDFDLFSSFEDDIAIVVMRTNPKFTYNSFVQPICLPAPGANYANITAVVTGWGSVASNGSSSDVLKEVSVPVWEHRSCIGNYSQNIFDTNLCAGELEGGKDACQGDSGGPLALQRQDGRWIIVGVVSWGEGCGDKGHPGIYTKVNGYLEWIQQNIL